MLGSSIKKGRHYLVDWIILINPKHIFEFGVGAGNLARAIKDKNNSIVIDGCDCFAPAVEYHLKNNSSPYSSIIHKDMRNIDFCHINKKYDMVLFGDSMEHIPERDARMILNGLSCPAIGIRIPVGAYPQGAKYGNKDEAHLWTFKIDWLEGFKDWKINMNTVTDVTPNGKSYKTYSEIIDNVDISIPFKYIGNFGLLRRVKDEVPG